ncbi:hypothetical protein BLOT_000568 [Blomia tropicalis]|nr:hypothetical protein BLOT_000568 [Blomia tropicalis]
MSQLCMVEYQTTVVLESLQQNVSLFDEQQICESEQSLLEPRGQKYFPSSELIGLYVTFLQSSIC